MPYAGGTSFLPDAGLGYVTSPTVLCQCPMRAGLHFYNIGVFIRETAAAECVNALCGRDFISTGKGDKYV